MALREFHGIITNQWDMPLFRRGDAVDSGDWQDPWYPSAVPGAGKIDPGHDGEWRSESTSVVSGTSGWARWDVHVDDAFDDHFETVQGNWRVPAIMLGRDGPTITQGVFRSQPDEVGAGEFGAPADPRPPFLEIVPVGMSDSGRNDSSALVPYFATIPVSWFLDSAIFGGPNHPVVHFIVRRKANSQAQSPLTFPNMAPSRQQLAMAAFRQRMGIAPAAGFVGAFPTFYETTQGANHLGGAVFVKAATAEWRDIPLTELGNGALDDFEGRMRATNTWARQHLTGATDETGEPLPFLGGFPTFFHADYGNGVVCGTVLIRTDGAEVRDIPLSELGNPALDDFEARFRATQDYASRHRFVGGFPTLEHRTAVVTTEVTSTSQRTPTQQAVVCRTVLLKRGDLVVNLEQQSDTYQATYAKHQNIVLFQDPS